jgi:hypothetical protein
MVAPAGLLQRFLTAARRHLTAEGVIVMPYYDFAGRENNPLIQGKRLGYEVREAFCIKGDMGAVVGCFSVYELRLSIGRRAARTK